VAFQKLRGNRTKKQDTMSGRENRDRPSQQREELKIMKKWENNLRPEYKTPIQLCAHKTKGGLKRHSEWERLKGGRYTNKHLLFWPDYTS